MSGAATVTTTRGTEGARRGGKAPTLRALFTDNPGRCQELCIWMELVGLLLGGVPGQGRVDPFDGVDAPS